jgi:hypothetical protein
MSESAEIDPAQRREMWLNERAAGRGRMAQGAAIVAGIALAIVLATFVFDGDIVLFVVTGYVCYAIVDGPRRILGGLATYLGAASELRALERRSTPASARLL